MGRTLYLDCSSGISGDMTVAALLDLGASQERLEATLASLPVGGFEIAVSRVSKNGLAACDFEDMTVAALLDLGASQERLEATLASLPVGGFEIAVSRVSKNGLAACDFDVRLDAAHENHDHDMAWLHGHEHGDGAAHGHHHGHGEDDHDHGGHHHGHAEHTHHHEHRGLADVLAIIGAAALTDRARSIATRIFEILADAEAQAHGTTRDQVHFHEVGAIDSIVDEILADAEAQAHGTTRDQVHFHEVGAIDSIVDVVSAAVCLDDLDVERVVVPELAEGCGTIRCAHGVIPVPVPAVCAVASAHSLPLRPTGVRGELVTPTGAAIVAAVRTDGELPNRYLIEHVGLGAGKRSYEGCSGILRAMLIDPAGDAPGAEGVSPTAAAAVDGDFIWKLECDIDDCTGEALGQVIETLMNAGAREAHEGVSPTAAAAVDGDFIWKLECDIDDCTGEALGQVIETLMNAGAREAHCMPLVTKKGRPAWQLQVICTEDLRDALERTVFEETTTIGIRRARMERTVLPRRAVTVATPLLQVICTEDLRDALERTVFEETTTIGIRRARMERTVLPRRAVTVATPLGKLGAKEVVLPSGAARVYPEHAEVVALARAAGVPYQQAWQAAMAGCLEASGR